MLWLLAVGIVIVLSGSIIQLFVPKSFSLKVNYVSAAVGSFLVFISSILMLLNNFTFNFSFKTSVPFLKIFIHLDALSEFFVLVISLALTAASIYSIGYMKEYMDKNVKLMNLIYSVFGVSMLLVVTAWNGFYFLITWELMSVTSYMLVSFDYQNEENKNAGYLYILMTHIGTVFITLSFILMAMKTGSLDFNTFRNTNLSHTYMLIVALCAFIGFGSKAGVVPLHIWLPHAHPVAPSNVSAIMSGVMIKTPIYMLLRFYLDFLHPGLGFGMFILLEGVVSGFLGVLYALMQHDYKVLLAYHSIENIGIIFMAMGLAIIFKATNHEVLYEVALVATLFHTINHASFKGLLFLAAGAVLNATHTRNIEKLGGLIKKMPSTALLFLIGSMAICALPPFNGFVSEWLVYQSLLGSFQLNSQTVRLLTPIFAAMLAITGGLALACFVKAFGISFLGNARSELAEKAKEVDNYMKSGMWVLAVTCLGLGLFPGIIFLLTKNLNGNVAFGSLFSLNSVVNPNSSVSNLLFLAVFTVIFLLTYWFIRPRRRVYQTWDCGINEYNPRAQYTAVGFAQPIRRIFFLILRPMRKEERIKRGFKYYIKKLKVEEEVTPIFERYLYAPLGNLTVIISNWIRSRVQCGSIHVYLLYMFVALIITLIYVRL